MIKTENNNVIKVGFGFLFLLVFLYVINPLSSRALTIYFFLTLASIFVYRSGEFQQSLIGTGKRNLGRSIFYGLLLGAIFILVTKFIPGFSLGVPTLPQAVSDELKFLIIVFIAPVVETLFFPGALLGYVRIFKPTKRNIILAVIIQAIAFSLFHVGAYIAGFEALPSLGDAFIAISSNFTTFFAAFVFATISALFVLRDGIKNLVFIGVFHFIINLFIYTSLTLI